jgi:hypothetical protein
MKKYEVIVKTDLKDRPKDHELSAALILAHYFKSDVIFLRPQIDKTPDIEENGRKWECQAPTLMRSLSLLFCSGIAAMRLAA